MKIKHLFYGLSLLALSVISCQDPDEIISSDNESLNRLSVTATLFGNDPKGEQEYQSIVNEQEGTITIQVPYYISDVEEIQGDLTQVKLVASLPNGAKFEPSISGIHDLSEEGEGIQSTLIKRDGSKTAYTIKAARVKSNNANIAKIALDDFPRLMYNSEIDENKKGNLTIFQTSSTVIPALKSAQIETAPWSTISIIPAQANAIIDGNKAKNINLSNFPTIRVTAQDGTYIEYKPKTDLPNLVTEGKIGYSSVLFGKQFYTDNTEGFELHANRTMAVVDDYLIIANAHDFKKMIVLNRYTGEVVTDKHVNTTGIGDENLIHAITSDDANHLVAMTYVSNGKSNPNFVGAQCDPQKTPSQVVYVYVWKDGIDQKPTNVVEGNIEGGAWTNAPRGINGVTTFDLGHNISVKGDITSGKAVLATSSYAHPRPVFLFFTDGDVTYPAYVEWAGGPVSMWVGTKVIPLTNERPLSYIWTTGNHNETPVMYVPTGTSDSRAVAFTRPSADYWWVGSSKYDHKVMGADYIDFNGMNLLAVQNGQAYNGGWIYRLYIGNISPNPIASSLANGYVFDSRTENPNISGTGPSLTGYTSSHTFSSGKSVFASYGDNCTETGDVVFAKSKDGTAIQVYMLTTDNGMFGYEITKYDI